MMDGFLNILKPPGMSSHDVIGAVRKVLHMKRVGHAGTLDPAAAGVLPIAVGQAARLIEYLELADKTYRAELTFGFATDSGDDTGKITEEVTPWAGMFVRDADPLITRYLKDRNLLFKKERLTHSYPFCWRCDTPLLYYARKSWYIKTTEYRDKMIEVNNSVNWYPKFVGEGRFGNWLDLFPD